MAMNALVVGGTGLVSSGVARLLLERGARVSVFNRGLRPEFAVDGATLIRGDRADVPSFVGAFEHAEFDVVRGRRAGDLRRPPTARRMARELVGYGLSSDRRTRVGAGIPGRAGVSAPLAEPFAKGAQEPSQLGG